MPDSSTITAIFSILTFLCTAYVIKILTQQINSQKDQIANLKTVSDTYEKLIEVLNKNKESYIEHAQEEIIDEFVTTHKNLIEDLVRKELDKQRLLTQS